MREPGAHTVRDHGDARGQEAEGRHGVFRGGAGRAVGRLRRGHAAGRPAAVGLYHGAGTPSRCENGGEAMSVMPFSARVGQDLMKRALVLNAISPAIGRVLIRGERGTAKSTAVR